MKRDIVLALIIINTISFLVSVFYGACNGYVCTLYFTAMVVMLTAYFIILDKGNVKKSGRVKKSW